MTAAFTTYTQNLFGEERWQQYLAAFNQPVPVSIRLNPFKTFCAITDSANSEGGQTDVVKADVAMVDSAKTDVAEADGESAVDNAAAVPVPWCRNGYYLPSRPDFTLDPLLHAGAYYVQEASSMFLDHVLQQYLPDNVSTVLDLCAAPGGKSTLLRAALPDDAVLFSNEPDRRRANILMENMQKQGHPKVIVTNNYPRDYRKTRQVFDLILADVPCSGEGMFRKDSGAIEEWSQANVMKCAELQRSIIADIWDNLRPGGILIYSTCTFNLHENEENILWIAENLGAEVLPVAYEPQWGITPSLHPAHPSLPVCRFIPGITQGEGLFMAVLRKTSDAVVSGKQSLQPLHILSDGKPLGTQKGKDVIPAHAEALLTTTSQDRYPRVELSLADALRYLRREALVLSPDIPRGYVVVTYRSLPLGFVKNIGNRANNLYPQEWRIRKG